MATTAKIVEEYLFINGNSLSKLLDESYGYIYDYTRLWWNKCKLKEFPFIQFKKDGSYLNVLTQKECYSLPASMKIEVNKGESIKEALERNGYTIIEK